MTLEGYSEATSTASQDVVVNFVGDGVIAGFPPGTEVPSWLGVENLDSSSTSARFRLSAYPGPLAPGTYRTVVRFLTGRLNSAGDDVIKIKSADLTVTLRVAQGISLSSEGTYLSVSEISEPVAREVSVSHSAGWSARSDSDWLSVSPTAGAGDAIARIEVDPIKMTAGYRSGSVCFTDTRTALVRCYAVSVSVSEAPFFADPGFQEFSVREAAPHATGSVAVHNSRGWRAASNAAWLAIDRDHGGLEETLALQIDAAGLEPGQYLAEIALVDEVRSRNATYQARLQVTEDPFTLVPSRAPVIEVYEGSQDVERQLVVQGPLAWTATSSPGVVLEKTAGGSGDTLKYTVRLADRAPGSYYEFITLTSRGGQQVTYDLGVYVKALQLVARPTEVLFLVRSDSREEQLHQQVSISDTGDGSSSFEWVAQTPSVPWLRVNPDRGNSRQGTGLGLALIAAELESMPPDTYTTEVVLRLSYPNGSTREARIPVQLVFTIPKVVSAMPYADQGYGEFVLGGFFKGVDSGGGIRVGGEKPTSGRSIDSRQAGVIFPPLTAGRYRVEVLNQLGLVRSTTEVVYLSETVYPAGSVMTNGVHSDLVFDRERQRIYLSSPSSGLVEVLAFDGSAWTAMPGVSVPGPAGLALSPDGKRLMVAGSDGLYQIPLDRFPLIADRVAQLPEFCGMRFNSLAAMNSQELVLTTAYPICSGHSDLYSYDLLDGSLKTRGLALYAGFVSAAADGGKVLFGQRGLSPEQGVGYFGPDGNLHDTGVTADLRSATLVPDDITLINGEAVYDRSFALLGRIPSGHVAAVATTDYVYAYSAERQMLDIYRLSAGTDNGFFKVQESRAVAASPGSTIHGVYLANFGQLVIVVGDERTVFVPVR